LVDNLVYREKENPRKHGRAGVRLYAFRLNGAWSSGEADCDLYTINGTTLTDTGTDVTVYDPLGIFSSLTTDDYGLGIMQAGKLYAIQAPCPA